MKKMESGHLFLTFMAIVGSILAVLGLVLGQLFPFFANEYYKDHTAISNAQLSEAIKQVDGIDLEERNLLLESIHVTEKDSIKIAGDSMARLAIVIILLLIVAFSIILFSTRSIVKNFLEPIINVTKTAQQLSLGNYRVRAYGSGSKIVDDLKESVNELASKLETLTNTRLVEEERLKTLMETMGSSLIMMNRQGQIIIANRQFISDFERTQDEVIGKSFQLIQLPITLTKFIDHVFLTEKPERQQISIERNGEIMYKEAFGAPVVGEHGKWLGIVIVLHDITEVVRLEQIRKDFVANVSHELKTPITSITGFTETLLDGAHKDEELLLSFLEIVHKESMRMQMLIHDLLELSKLEQQGYEIEQAEVSIQQALARVIDVAMQKLEEKNIQLSVQMEKDVVVAGEENRIIQILTNLINNAIMYSPNDSNIQVNVYEDNAYGVMEVVDDGIGIAKEDAQRIFERFYRVDTARSRNSGGTGLGLAIVKHLVELHHGKIDVDSELGKGTTMRVKIPLAKK